MKNLALVLPDENPVHVYLASKSRSSRRTLRDSLTQIARRLDWTADVARFPWHEIRLVHASAIRNWLADNYAPSTANKSLAALRGVLRQCFRFGFFAEHDLRFMLEELKYVRGERPLVGRALTQGELRAVFGACDGATELGARDAALVALLYGSGIRRAEAGALLLSECELDAEQPRIIVRRGKGNKGRIVYLPSGTVRALVHYLVLRGKHEGPLFHPTRGRTHRLQRHLPMAIESITFVMHRLAHQAAIPRFTPHDCRRTHIGDKLDAKVDIVTVQKGVGHAQLSTTARYDRRGDRALAQAADSICVPFD